ncbi:MAG: hypothetical protein A2186_00390 [Candidatus Levybacteria bacterium RIFOXYA1_FULL_41_10]|nr:MAG: Rhodanese-like protein [Candidatus Levybacteria bacterium GW2011_GWA1_39_32]KKR50906.1 MAG: Rhodanese-like protein [Candidatus Levybacteria bacterium GW2011_GWC1_40_19]KKR73171.1 MAG: Rhodanese-like protein [Candidatus Levybacteria bacterium GW2011_GWC2_40_7]KKR94058.1 MAG: Rhodanese-like protein [Candidatus Levybacteria bacterium GW2011_GWA2_41_15]KKS01179.1 MAG: Rhodanese-like protein [Candidatus Levybacteria bacterium GW2011_GWB1_41_21]OGH21133.1 MAG: hypothetical protein A2695_0266
MFGFSKSVPSITAEEVKQALDTKADVTIVDVRTPDEYRKGHLEGSLLLPVDTVSEKAASVLKDKKETLYVYCLSGSRSIQAADILLKLGYTRVFNMTSGLLAWRAKGYSLIQ